MNNRLKKEETDGGPSLGRALLELQLELDNGRKERGV